MEKEEHRKAIRDQTRDLNRPNFNEHLPSENESDLEWSDESDEKPYRESHNDSLRSAIQIERFNKISRLKRTKSYTNNRRSTSESKFKSCMSLESEYSSNASMPSPKKTCTRNFIEHHHTDVNRMSDYYIPPRQLIPDPVDNRLENKSQTRWREFLISLICLGFTCGWLAYKNKSM